MDVPPGVSPVIGNSAPRFKRIDCPKGIAPASGLILIVRIGGQAQLGCRSCRGERGVGRCNTFDSQACCLPFQGTIAETGLATIFAGAKFITPTQDCAVSP